MNLQQTHQSAVPTSTDSVANAILVHDLAGTVVHSFLPASDAHKRLDEALANRSAGSVFVVEEDMGAELCFSVCPDLRSRVAEAKLKLQRGLRWQRIMDEHGVPTDRELRERVAKAMSEILSDEAIATLMPDARARRPAN